MALTDDFEFERARGAIPLRARLLGQVFVSLLVVTMAALSVHRSPRIAEFLWLPDSIAEWTNRYGVLRNTPAFGFLAVVVGLLIGSRKRRVLGYLSVAGFAALCELAQLWIPTRFCDVRDVGAGWLGVALAASIVELSKVRAERWRR